MADADPRNLSDAHTQQPSLNGRKAVITGGTTGIGRAIAVLLASEGVEIFTCGRDEQHLADGLERINEVGKGSGIALDLAEKGNVDTFFAEADKALGNYDIAIVNAAIPVDGVANSKEGDIDYAVAIDYVAYVLSAHRAAKQMKDKGDLILVGSMSGHYLGGDGSIYAGMKRASKVSPRRCTRSSAPRGSRLGSSSRA